MSRPRILALLFCFLVLCDATKALLFISNGEPPLYKDALGYWKLGSQIADGDWLLWQSPIAARPPGYPVFLACIQAAFGEYGLVAATVTQQICFVAVSLITAWICGQVTESNAGILIGLLLSVACISRHIVGQQMFSDNLLCLMFTAYCCLLVVWYRCPSVTLAMLVGIAIAACMLVKPVTQLLWLPTLALMGIRLHELRCFRRLLSHGAVMIAVMTFVIAPWFLRNYLCFGQPFLTKFSGRALWWACFDSPPDRQATMAGLAFSDRPQTSRAFAEIDGMGIDTRHCWSVYDALRKRGYSEIESEDLMLAVCLEAIREQPKEFALTRVGHFILCWIKPPNGEWFRYDQPMVEGTTIVAGRYDGQKTWYCPSLADLHNTLMRHLWKPRRRVYLLGAMAVLGSWLAMLLNPRLRTMGVAFGLVMGYLSAVLTVFGQPEYRYRIVLEPVMIVVFVAGAGSVIEMVRARRDRAILKSPEVK